MTGREASWHAGERVGVPEPLAQAHRFETVAQLAGGLVHDLNNLLTILVSNVSLAQETITGLERGAPLEGGLTALREDLDALHQASSRVDGLTRRLLNVAAPAPPSTTEVDVGASLRSMAALVGRSLDAGVVLDVDVPDDVPDIEVDPGRLEQAVTNLVINAGDALAEGGTIRLAARGERRAAASGGGADEGGEVVTITIRDEGSGMPPEVLERAFEPLFTTKGPERGTGLGLPTVLRFVEDAGGSLHVDTAVGRGTEVALRLPAVAAAVVADPVTVSSAERTA